MMAPKHLATALGFVAATALGVLAARPASQAAGADLRLHARWAVPHSPTINLHPYDIAYLDDDTLLFTNPHEADVWAIDGDGRNLRRWASETTKFWLPTGIDTNHTTRQVVIGDRKQQRFIVIGDDGQRLPTGWRIVLPRLGPEIPEHAALGPDGSVYVLSGYGTSGGQRVFRIGLDGKQLAAWDVQPRRLPEIPRPYAQRIALDAEGRVYLALQSMGGCEPQIRRCEPKDLRPTVDIYRFTHSASRGEFLGVFAGPDDRLPWSGWHDESLSLAALPDRDRLFVGRYDPPHVTAYDLATGDRVLYTYPPQPAAIDRVAALAARPDGGFAAMLGMSDNPKLNQPPFGHVVQFAADGEPDSRFVLRAGDDPLFWPAGRISVDGLGRTHVLSPDAQHVHTLSSAGWAMRTVPALSWPVDLAADASGRVALKGSGGQRGHVALLDATGDLSWEADCQCDETSALAIRDDLVVSGEAIRGALDGQRMADGASVAGLQTIGRDRFWPADLAATDRGLFALDADRGEVTLWAGGAPRLARGPSMLVGSDVVRIAAHPDGRLATLSRDGTVRAYGPSGGLTHAARVTDVTGAEDAQPRDLSWGPGDRLHVFDAARPSVLVLELATTTAAPTPTVPPAGQPVCKVTGDKTAAPDTVQLGESVTVTLTLAGECPKPPPNEVDLVLLMADLSYGTGQEVRDHEQTQALAAKRLVRGLDLNRVHVAVFQEAHGMHLGLSNDAPAVLEAIDAVGQRWPYQLAPDWSEHFGFAKAAEHLLAAGRPAARKMIVYSMRRQPVDYPFYETAAAAARADGIELVVVNYDSPSDAALARVAGPPENLIDWRDAATTDAVFNRIGGPALSGEIRDVTITDTMYRDVRYEADSAVPPAWVRGTDLVWEFAALDAAGRTFTYRIRPQRTGRYPTNQQAVADYTDADGTRRRFVFPVPVIDVIGPTATPTHTPTPTLPVTATPEPTPTRVPKPVYVPIALRERCSPETRRMDAALVIDASTSMLELTSGGRTKLAAAQEAGQTFLDRLRLDAGDQATIVSFNAAAVVNQGLTSDRAALDAALSGIQVAQQTRIDLAIEAALGELVSPRGDPANQPVMIVLTDGRANPVGPEMAVERAEEAKAAGVVVFTVGLGDTLDVDALREMASGPKYFHLAPDGEDLAEIYGEIAVDIPCPAEAFWGKR